MPRVSAIVPAYNAARYLKATIESVRSQTYDDWELIVVDDGSTDDTRLVVQSYAPALGMKLRYIYQPNRGLPAARNTAIREARGEFIGILDADDVWLPARLERGVALMDRSPEVGLVHAKIARIDVGGAVIGVPVFPPRKYQSGKIAIHLLTRRARIACPTVLFRRRCLETSGFFDEAMGATEDRDLWFRIAEHFEVAYIDEILAYSRATPGSMTSDSDRMLKWQLFFVHKHYNRHACGWATLHRALGQIYREQGDVLFSRGRVSESIGHYSRSLFYNPLNLKNVYMLLRAGAEPILGSILNPRKARGTAGNLV
jgi:glycosyltransferase involved in cell wall biosynthesis